MLCKRTRRQPIPPQRLLIATGQIDNTLEGVYTLDPITGDLRGVVLNPTRPSVFAAHYAKNISNDFGNTLKNPKFVMVTGIIDMRQGVRGNVR